MELKEKRKELKKLDDEIMDLMIGDDESETNRDKEADDTETYKEKINGAFVAIEEEM